MQKSTQITSISLSACHLFPNPCDSWIFQCIKMKIKCSYFKIRQIFQHYNENEKSNSKHIFQLIYANNKHLQNKVKVALNKIWKQLGTSFNTWRAVSLQTPRANIKTSKFLFNSKNRIYRSFQIFFSIYGYSVKFFGPDYFPINIHDI